MPRRAAGPVPHRDRMGRAPRRRATSGKLDDELDRLERIPLLVCDEVGYIPFDPQAASLMFMLVSRRYERRSMIVTSNKPFSAWGEIFGDDMAATAMVDRLIHHAHWRPSNDRPPARHSATPWSSEPISWRSVSDRPRASVVSAI